MTATETSALAAAITQVREIITNPERVVLDPNHYAEIDHEGRRVALGFDEILAKREHCRVCFAGAAVIAASEHLEHVDFSAGVHGFNPVIDLLTDHAQAIGVEVTGANLNSWGDGPVGVLTQAMIDDRAGEVCDHALAALEVAS